MTHLKAALRGFRAAVVFLTVLPLPDADLTGDDFARASLWFPAVGLVLGAVLAITYVGLARLAPASVGAALLLLTWTVLTGGLHLDGFVDCADALPAAVPVERRLELLEDVHVGAYGVVATALLFLVQWSCLQALWATPFAVGSLVTAPVAGRALIVWAQVGWPYARREGMGHLVPSEAYDRLAALLWLAGAALLGGRATLVAAAGTLVVVHGIAAWMARRLGGGLTGDAYGALCVTGETTVLVIMSMFTLVW